MAMSGNDPGAGTADRYRAFAEEARGRSQRYVELALQVADDPEILDFLGAFPGPKRQPNLLFATACYLLGDYASIAALRKLVAGRGGELAAAMLARRTQTNEAARCATLLPALAALPQPLALIEVGASAGLTLLPDRYSYDFGGHGITGNDPAAPVLECSARGPVPLPDRVPPVVWRAGLDLNPLDVLSDDDVRWLRCLIWPGETGRRERLDAAIATARRDPPRVWTGDLLTDLPGLCRQAPADATVVVFHSAVLAYVDSARRREFADIVGSLGVVWLANEAPGVLPWVSVEERDRESFVLIRDGQTALARTDGHGMWLEWLERLVLASRPAPAGSGRARVARRWPGRSSAAGARIPAAAEPDQPRARPAGQIAQRSRAPAHQGQAGDHEGAGDQADHPGDMTDLTQRVRGESSRPQRGRQPGHPHYQKARRELAVRHVARARERRHGRGQPLGGPAAPGGRRRTARTFRPPAVPPGDDERTAEVRQLVGHDDGGTDGDDHLGRWPAGADERARQECHRPAGQDDHGHRDDLDRDGDAQRDHRDGGRHRVQHGRKRRGAHDQVTHNTNLKYDASVETLLAERVGCVSARSHVASTP